MHIITLTVMPSTLAICDLFFGSRPAAIPRFVIAVIVDSVNGMFRRRFFTHVSKEIYEEMPALTNGDATTSPVLITLMARIFATFSHRMPTMVFMRVRPTMSDHHFFTKTTATFLAFLTQHSGINNHLLATVTLADPSYTRCINGLMQDKQTENTFACQINLPHRRNYNEVGLVCT